MISCTEFIPAYSELFTYLENNYGRDEVSQFWNYLFTPQDTGIPLISFIKREGIRGCFSYWAGTLNEEAADFTMYLNEKAGWFMNVMHHCPSKGRLLELEQAIGIKPYHDYCLHCDLYRLAAEQMGLKYIYNFNGVDHAECSMLIYDPKVFDGRVIIDENTEIMDRKASQNEYFHRDFHNSLNMGVEYLGTKYGTDVVRDYLTTFTKHVYAPVIEAMKKDGLAAIEAKIRDTYKREKAEDAVEIVRDGDTMTVTVKYCPGVKHLRATGRTISDWYRYATETVMDTLAKSGGYHFVMESYNDADGAAKYRFEK